MKALILAAGFGSRLTPITNSIPKALVPVNGKPILFKQIDNLYENGIDDITIVAGYKSNVLREKVLESYPEVKIIQNNQYDISNNMFSAFIGISYSYCFNKSLRDEDDKLLMMNSDVFFDSSIISELIKDEYENAIVVDIGNYNDESMKVIQRGSRIVEISKKITKEDALGNSIDVYKFNREGVKNFLNKCYDYIIMNKNYNSWSEVALNDTLKEVEFKVCPLKGRWFEIDNHEDLRQAEKLFSEGE